MDAIDPQQVVSVGGFALLVLYLLRELRPVLKELVNEQFEMRVLLATWMERDRVRDNRRKRRDSDQNYRNKLSDSTNEDFADEESTDIGKIEETVRLKLRKGERIKTPPVGVGVYHRPGSHHDKDGK